MTLTLSENAAKKILNLIQEESDPASFKFRIMVSGGGCAGFQYIFSLDNVSRDDDHIFQDKGVTIVLDEASMPFLEGVEIDYVEDLIGASFQVKNPNASSSCGCGNSFSL
ncbi:MAG: iron-sulfur cluster insertion protein ErpA [Proteobacteria bacterium]|nr:iron-sulfur cluster insertion protein ErpA [Pseudomonadota bacterium]